MPPTPRPARSGDPTPVAGLLRVLPCLLALAASAGSPLLATSSDLVDRFTADLSLRHIGPVGNRVPAVTGVPGDPLVYLAGAASGGIWKSVDGGVRWRPVFDDQDVASIGSLAVAPSDPNVVWAGTGETFIRSNVSIGDGIYRSTDGGETWEHRGLEATGRIGRIVVHPDDPDVVYAAALGHSYGPQPERGLFRTRDGGATWEKVLFVDERTGAIDVAMQPGNPRILWAATWQFEMRTSGRTSGGPGSGIWRSRDGGDTWTRLGPQTPDEHAEDPNGTPKGPWGKIGLTVSADDPQRIYALIETSSNADFAPVEGWDGPGFQGVLWRSDDRGDHWRLVSSDNTLHQRPLYYTRMVAAPDDADELTFLSVQQSLSVDGGLTISEQNSGWDHHDLWIDPQNPDRRISGHDGGVSITLDRGRHWFRPQLPIAQMYHVNVDDQIPYLVYGNRQDGDAMRGPSNSKTGGGIPLSAWQSVGGCEVGFAVPRPGDPDTVWTGCYDGILERYDARSGHSRDVSVKPLAIESWAAKDLEFRFQWSFPIEISPHDPDVVYVGSQYVHRTTDGGTSWTAISPDLSTGDEELMLRTGGLTLDDAGPTVAAVVFAIAESPLVEGQIWAGTNDGRLHVTRDGGATWSDLSSRLPDLPPLGTISNIEPSRHDPDHVYVTVDRHQEGDDRTWVFKSEDGGASWRSLRSDLPQDRFSFAHCIREDPEVPGLLYLGTHNALWVSLDDGASWGRVRSGLPPAPVSWIEVQERFGDLVLSTYGRGFWILDDLTPLRAAARGTASAAPTLLAPRDTFRLRSVEATQTVPDVPATGTNPRDGVPLHVVVPEPSPDRRGTEAPALRLQIVDPRGEVVRTLDDLDRGPGVHRVWWNLRGEATLRAERTLPPRDQPRSRPGTDGGSFSILQPPGTYTVRLQERLSDEEAEGREPNPETMGAGGRPLWRTLDAESFEILMDPASTATPADLDRQIVLLRELHVHIDRAATLVNDLESLRGQVTEWAERVRSSSSCAPDCDDGEAAAEAGDDGPAPELESLAADLDAYGKRLEEMEDQLVDLRLTAAGQDTLRWQRRLLAQFTYLAWRIHGSDHAPTQGQLEVASALGSRLEQLDERWGDALADLADLNRRLAAAGVTGIR